MAARCDSAAHSPRLPPVPSPFIPHVPIAFKRARDDDAPCVVRVLRMLRRPWVHEPGSFYSDAYSTVYLHWTPEASFEVKVRRNYLDPAVSAESTSVVNLSYGAPDHHSG